MDDTGGEVILYSDEIRWNIEVEVVGENEDRCIELSWGWTVGWTKEQLATLADDSPRGSDSVLITAENALELIALLAESVAEIQSKTEATNG